MKWFILFALTLSANTSWAQGDLKITERMLRQHADSCLVVFGKPSKIQETYYIRDWEYTITPKAYERLKADYVRKLEKAGDDDIGHSFLDIRRHIEITLSVSNVLHGVRNGEEEVRISFVEHPDSMLLHSEAIGSLKAEQVWMIYRLTEGEGLTSIRHAVSTLEEWKILAASIMN